MDTTPTLEDTHTRIAERARADAATERPRYTGDWEEAIRLQRENERSIERIVAEILPVEVEVGPAVFDGLCHTYKTAFAAARSR